MKDKVSTKSASPFEDALVSSLVLLYNVQSLSKLLHLMGLKTHTTDGSQNTAQPQTQRLKRW